MNIYYALAINTLIGIYTSYRVLKYGMLSDFKQLDGMDIFMIYFGLPFIGIIGFLLLLFFGLLGFKFKDKLKEYNYIDKIFCKINRNPFYKPYKD